MPLAALESSWLSVPVFKRNTLYNSCAPENCLNPCNLSGTSSLTTTTYTITLSVTSVRMSLNAGRPSLPIPTSRKTCYVTACCITVVPSTTPCGTSTWQTNFNLQSRTKASGGMSTSVLPRPNSRICHGQKQPRHSHCHSPLVERTLADPCNGTMILLSAITISLWSRS